VFACKIQAEGLKLVVHLGDAKNEALHGVYFMEGAESVDECGDSSV